MESFYVEVFIPKKTWLNLVLPVLISSGWLWREKYQLVWDINQQCKHKLTINIISVHTNEFIQQFGLAFVIGLSSNILRANKLNKVVFTGDLKYIYSIYKETLPDFLPPHFSGAGGSLTDGAVDGRQSAEPGREPALKVSVCGPTATWSLWLGRTDPALLWNLQTCLLPGRLIVCAVRL